LLIPLLLHFFLSPNFFFLFSFHLLFLPFFPLSFAPLPPSPHSTPTSSYAPPLNTLLYQLQMLPCPSYSSAIPDNCTLPHNDGTTH
jgi:hypothetical protein